MNFKRVFVVVGAPFLLASLVASFLPLKAMFIFIGTAFIALIASFYIVKTQFATLVHISIAGVILISGIYTYKYQFEVIPIRELSSKKAVVEATITGIIKEGAGSNGYNAVITRHPFSNVPKQFKTNIYSPNALNVDYYDTVTVEVEFFTITNMATVDVQKIYLSDNIYIFAYAQKYPFGAYSPPVKPIPGLLKSINAKLCEIMELNMDRKTSALCKAMLLGERGGIDELTQYKLSNIGVMHLLSVSGLHVTIISGMLMFVLSLFKVRKRLLAIITIMTIWIFVALTGFLISAVRAGIMLTVMQMGVFFNEKADGLNSLFLSGFIIILLNPFSINDIGFKFTLCCTFGIVALAKPFANALKKAFGVYGRIGSFIAQSISVTLCITVCCLPILINISKGFHVLTPFVNLYAVPLAGIIIPLCVVMLIVSPIPFLCNIVGGVIEFLCDIFLKSVYFLSQFDFLFIGLDYPIVGTVLVIAACLVIFTLLYFKKGVMYAITGAVAAVLLAPVIYRGVMFNHHLLTTFSTYNGSYIITEYRGKADVIIVEGDEATGASIAKYLSGRNINIINNFILLDQTTTISDLSVALDTKVVKEIFVDTENNISQRLECKVLKPYLDYNISSNLFATADTATLKYGDAIICITTDDTVATEAKCEILFFYKKTLNETQHFSSKYVILLNRSVDSEKENTINAYDRQISLDITTYRGISNK